MTYNVFGGTLNLTQSNPILSAKAKSTECKMVLSAEHETETGL